MDSVHRIKIFGRLYALHGGDRVPAAAKVVDELMQSISGLAPGLDPDQVAVLAAVHLASILHAVEDGESSRGAAVKA